MPKKKTPAAVKRRTPRKKAAPPIATSRDSPRPSRILQGLRVAAAGDAATQKLAHQIARDLGATIVKKVDEKTHYLIVGSGRKPAQQTQAERLNARGAEIVVCEDVRELLRPLGDHLATYVRDPRQYVELCRFLNRNIFHWQDLILDGADFSGAEIGVAGKEMVSLDEISVRNCNFSDATLTSLSLGQYDDAVEACNFDGAVFNDAFLTSPKHCSLQRVRGKRLGIGRLHRGLLEFADLESLTIYHAHQSEIVGCKLGNLGDNGETEFSKTTLSNCRIARVQCKAMTFSGSTLEEVRVAGGTAGDLCLEKCKLRNVRFENLKDTNIDLQGCELENCEFRQCQGGLFDFGNSKVRDCRFARNTFSRVIASQKQAEQLKGLNERLDVKQLRRAQKWAKSILASRQVQLQLQAEQSTGSKVKLKLNSRFVVELECRSATNKKDRDVVERYRSSYTPNRLAFDVLQLLTGARVVRIQDASIRAKLEQCPLSSKAFRDLTAAALADLTAIASS